MPRFGVSVTDAMADSLFERLHPSLTVSELPGSEVHVWLDTPAHEVARLFEDEADLVGVIVLDRGAGEDRTVGVISRAAFLERLSHPYALELYIKRPIANMIDVIDVEPQVVPATCGVPEAADLALKRPVQRVF